jgi:hypothetical protein
VKKIVFAALLWVLPFAADAVVVYSQPPSDGGALLQSSWWDPDGSDYDQYVWDDFTLPSAQAITAIAWRGGYDPTHFGMGGPVIDFTVEIWSSIEAGTQPDIGSVFAPNPLVQYTVGGNAGETLAGTFGGTTMYDYHFTLPAPFQAAAGTKYWVQIEAWQHGIPDWGLAAGTGGDGNYFRRIANVGDIFYQIVPGDAAFTLLAAGPPIDTPTPTATPTATDTPVPSPTVTPTASPTPTPCTGDCNGDTQVTIAELVSMVEIALEQAPMSACEAGDRNHDGRMTVDEIVAAVRVVLTGCGL